MSHSISDDRCGSVGVFAFFPESQSFALFRETIMSALNAEILAGIHRCRRSAFAVVNRNRSMTPVTLAKTIASGVGTRDASQPFFDTR